MRPGLRFRRVWTPVEAAELGSALAGRSAATSMPCSLLRVSRSCINQILAQARPNRQAPVTVLVRKPRPVQRRSGAPSTRRARTRRPHARTSCTLTVPALRTELADLRAADRDDSRLCGCARFGDRRAKSSHRGRGSGAPRQAAECGDVTLGVADQTGRPTEARSTHEVRDLVRGLRLNHRAGRARSGPAFLAELPAGNARRASPRRGIAVDLPPRWLPIGSRS